MARFNAVFRSIASDNGSEFTLLPQMLPETPVCYAHPYSAYEHGLNEKQNSLLGTVKSYVQNSQRQRRDTPDRIHTAS